MTQHNHGELNTPDGTFSSGRQFAGFAMELMDSEVTAAFEIVESARRKYAGMPNTEKNLQRLSDEIVTRLSDIGILATLDPTPVVFGDPPVLEIIGKIGDVGFQQATDYEKKSWEVRKAHNRQEYFLGERESVDSTPARKRAKSAAPKKLILPNEQ
jgi:hypothetical protein